jgi:hypothetical protein
MADHSGDKALAGNVRYRLPEGRRDRAVQSASRMHRS